MTKLANVARSGGRLFIAIQRWILILAGAALVLDVFAEVVLRYVMRHFLFGTDELAAMIAVWVYFFGAAHATHTRTHIEGGIVITIIKQQVSRYKIRFAVLIVTMIMGVVFTYMAYEWCHWTVTEGITTTSLLMPTIYGEVAMLIGAVLMEVYFGIEAAETWQKIRQGSPEVK